MKVSFTLRSIKCLQTLSSADAPWCTSRDIRDGIKLSFSITSANEGFSVTSGEDPTLGEGWGDTIPMWPGRTVDLRTVPPESGGSAWYSGGMSFAENDLVTITVMGLNVGLPYMGGGGGGSNDIAKTVMNLFGLLPVPGASAIAKGTNAVIDFVDENFNKFSDCKGVAFGFRLTVSAGNLLSQVLKSSGRSKKLTLRNSEQSLAFGFEHSPKLSVGCNVPDYEIELEVQLEDSLAIVSTVDVTPAGESERTLFQPDKWLCPPPPEMKIWTSYNDSVIRFIPNFRFFSIPMKWIVKNKILPQSQGTITIDVIRFAPISEDDVSGPVALAYRIEEFGGVQALVISSQGKSDGNFLLQVEAKLTFPDGSEVSVAKKSQQVVGQDAQGDENFQKWSRCEQTTLLRIHDRIRRLVFRKSPIPDPIGPVSIEDKLGPLALRPLRDFLYDLREEQR